MTTMLSSRSRRLCKKIARCDSVVCSDPWCGCIFARPCSHHGCLGGEALNGTGPMKRGDEGQGGSTAAPAAEATTKCALRTDDVEMDVMIADLDEDETCEQQTVLETQEDGSGVTVFCTLVVTSS